MNLRDGRHDGRIDLETAFERYRSRIPINDVDTVLALKRDQPRDRKCYERICGEVSSVEAKDSSGGTTTDEAGALPRAVYTKQ